MNRKSHLLMLLLAAFFWGTTFVAQSIGADYVPANTYLAGRSWIAVVFLTPIVHALDRYYAARGVESRRPRTPEDRKRLGFAACVIGSALWGASAAQQVGMAYTTTAKASFITALYVVIVPLLSIVLHRRPPLRVWLCVILSLVGMYLLCMGTEHLYLDLGDSWVLGSAFLYALQIMLVDRFSPKLDSVRLSRLQFLVVALLSTAAALLTERPTPDAILLGLPAICYAGIFSSGIAYTLQILGQENVNPAVASLVMSLESVFGALSGWLVLQEAMSLRELSGCCLMFAAILLCQIEPPRRRSKTGSADAAASGS